MKLEHTFVISAYKESEYLEACIQSLKAQTLQTNILMTTSTLNEHIKNLADKYNIPLFIRDGESNLRDDWNFAYDHADTEWVTIAHQDDLYDKKYAEELAKKVVCRKDVIAFVTDYLPIKHGKIGPRDINSVLRRILRAPLKDEKKGSSPYWKRSILKFGNSICCPSVSYNKKKLGPSFFTSELKYNIDWDTFLKLADIEGEFAYTDKTLTYYRISDEATSAKWIANHSRENDDRTMFRKFWPEWFVNILMIFYVKAYDTYSR